ncbi:hypothetical protein [Draconibacterium orientale]|uniref:hypothetical protein n=1 Tax=Draconibacterium orientale TaxID=1168034 RepID=UPI002ABD4041|nr:hypothetical protein [Draconibacterium orientale]
MKNFMLVLMVFVLASCGMANSPEKVVENYVTNMFAGNISECVKVMVDSDNKAISLLPEKEVKEIEEFLEGVTEYMVESLKEEYEVEEIEIESIDFTEVDYNESKDKAKVSYQLKVKGIDKLVDDLNTNCVKVDGEWKMVLGN